MNFYLSYTLYSELLPELHIKQWTSTWVTHYTVNFYLSYTSNSELLPELHIIQSNSKKDMNIEYLVHEYWISGIITKLKILENKYSHNLNYMYFYG